MEAAMSDDIPEFPTLNVHGGAIDGYEMKLSPGMTVIIGSGRLAQMRLDHPDIELAHVKVAWDDQGISMIDNGSRKGTWVNGEPVETVSLLDGDVIEFVGPGNPATPPKVKVRIPKGVVPEPPPPPPPSPEELAARSAPARTPAAARGRVPARRRARGPRLRLPDLRLVGLAAGALVLVALGGWTVQRVFFAAPVVEAVNPAQAEPGQTLTVTGKRFDGDAPDNVVWFGDRSVPATSVAGGTLQVTVPPLYRAGATSLVVQTGGGRSNAVPFVALLPIQVVSLDPLGALPGDEVTLSGSGFTDEVSVTVGGAAARVVSVEKGALRFEMPAVAGAPGSLHDVVASAGARKTKPLALYLGRVPLVVSFEPARGVAGDLVRVRGAGFVATPEGNVVTFDGVKALVVAANPTEMAVVVPPPARPQPETLAPVVVQAGGKTSAEGAGFPVQQLVEGTWVPRFLAGALVEASAGQAVVGTQVAPVLLLSGKDESRSVGERALRVASALNAIVDRARVGQPATFEAREEPSPGVALLGLSRPDREGHAGRRRRLRHAARPSRPRSAPHAGGARPALGRPADRHGRGRDERRQARRPRPAITPAAGAAFAQLRAALPWQYGSGVSCARVVALPAELKRRLREAALRVP